MNTQITIAAIGAGGASFGVLLTGIGYFLKIRAERLKTRRNVLFHLLEIRHSIRSEYANSEDFLKKYLAYCEEYMRRKGLSDLGPIPDQLKEIIVAHFSKLMEAVKPCLGDDFIKSFEKSISILSLDAPVLAYKLRGRDRINQILDAQRSYISSFNSIDLLKNLEVIKDATSEQMIKANDVIIESLIEEIDNDIQLVSRQCGALTILAVRRILREKSRPKIEFNISELDTFMDEMLDAVIDAAQRQEQESIKSLGEPRPQNVDSPLEA